MFNRGFARGTLLFNGATLLLTSMYAPLSIAAGFQLNAQSATGIGRAFAGDPAIADNPAAISRNAAAMTFFDHATMSIGIERLTTHIKVKDATYKNAVGVNESANVSDAGHTDYVPNFFYVHPVNDAWAYGVGLYSNFGTKTLFDDQYAGYEFGGRTTLKTVNLGMMASYQVNDQWRVGGGIDVIYGQGKLKRTWNQTLVDNTALTSTTALDADVNGWDLGWNAGVIYAINDDNRLSLDYHYSPNLELKGTVNKLGTTASDDTVHLILPSFAEFAGYHRLSPSYAIHYSIQWTDWSSFTNISADQQKLLQNYNWRDSWRYAIGGTYYVNQIWTLRAGYMIENSAQNQRRSISVPDSDRQWFSTGFTYHAAEHHTIDVGVTYLIGNDATVSEEKTSGATQLSSLSATTQTDAVMFAVQYSHQF